MYLVWKFNEFGVDLRKFAITVKARSEHGWYILNGGCVNVEGKWFGQRIVKFVRPVALEVDSVYKYESSVGGKIAYDKIKQFMTLANRISSYQKNYTIKYYFTRLDEILDAMVSLFLTPVVNGFASFNGSVEIKALGFRTEGRCNNFLEVGFWLETVSEVDLVGQTQLDVFVILAFRETQHNFNIFQFH